MNTKLVWEANKLMDELNVKFELVNKYDFAITELWREADLKKEKVERWEWRLKDKEKADKMWAEERELLEERIMANRNRYEEIDRQLLKLISMENRIFNDFE